MQKETTNANETPFLNLLNDAEEIRIRELPNESHQSTGDSIQKILSQFEKIDNSTDRAFVILIKSPKKIDPVKENIEGKNLPRNYLLESANILLGDQDYLLARNIYSFLLKKEIRDREALKGLGICFLRLGDPLSAKKCFRALAELYQEEEANAWLGFCAVIEGNERLACEYFSKVNNPTALHTDLQFEYYKEKGNAATRLGKFQEAEKNYLLALELRPQADIVYVNMGTLAMQQRNWELAHTHFLKATQLNPKNARAHCGIGLIAMEMGQTIFAEQEFEKTLDLDSQNTVALIQLVQFAHASNKFQKVKTRLISYLEKDPKNNEIRYLLATCLFKEANYHSAEKEIDTILLSDSTHQKARTLKSEITHNKHQ